MPELLTAHPEVTLEVLKEQGARCGIGVRPTILKSCPPEKLCALHGGEVCVFGPTELGLMTQLTYDQVCGALPLPPPRSSASSPVVAIGLALVAVTSLTTASIVRFRRQRRRTPSSSHG